MKHISWISLAAGLCSTSVALAADPPPAETLVVKPLLCEVEKSADACTVTFDIRWKSVQPSEYCLNDSVKPTPLHCWPRTTSGDTKHERSFSEDFSFWLTPPTGGERVAEVKIEVLRVGSNDRRRERRTRHVWDVL
jgi:hypothetical protein